ncbi:autotransporter-associated beta strand repeat-containing protein [Salmonella sp. gx-f7]
MVKSGDDTLTLSGSNTYTGRSEERRGGNEC